MSYALLEYGTFTLPVLHRLVEFSVQLTIVRVWTKSTIRSSFLAYNKPDIATFGLIT